MSCIEGSNPSASANRCKPQVTGSLGVFAFWAACAVFLRAHPPCRANRPISGPFCQHHPRASPACASLIARGCRHDEEARDRDQRAVLARVASCARAREGDTVAALRRVERAGQRRATRTLSYASGRGAGRGGGAPQACVSARSGDEGATCFVVGVGQAPRAWPRAVPGASSLASIRFDRRACFSREEHNRAIFHLGVFTSALDETSLSSTNRLRATGKKKAISRREWAACSIRLVEFPRWHVACGTSISTAKRGPR